MKNQTDKNPATPAMKRGVSITVLGVGGAGCNAVNHLARESFAGVTFAVMNTDAAALAQSPVEARLNLGAKTTRGLGAGGDPERGRSAAEEDVGKIRALCDGAEVVFIVAGEGGGTGTGASPVVARVARETGALVLGIVMLPFECEGKRRQRQAHLGLQELRAHVDGVICLPNQKVFRLIDERTSLIEAFGLTNELVAQGVRGIWRLLSRPGLINVDFADLRAVVQGQHAESSLATAEAFGENRSREVVEKLLAHPLIEGGAALNESTGVLISIAGGQDLTMAEVNRVMEQLSRQCANASIIMGAAIDEELGGRLNVTLVASRKFSADSVLPPQDANTGGSSSGCAAEAPLANSAASGRPASRFAAPPPPLTPEKAEQLFSRQTSGAGRPRQNGSRARQGQLPLEIISKGRFEKSEPTVYHGQDLDVPTYIRRGVALN